MTADTGPYRCRFVDVRGKITGEHDLDLLPVQVQDETTGKVYARQQVAGDDEIYLFNEVALFKIHLRPPAGKGNWS